MCTNIHETSSHIYFLIKIFNTVIFLNFCSKYKINTNADVMTIKYQPFYQQGLKYKDESGLTLHDFRRTTDQIGCDMSRRVITGNRGK